MGQCQFLESVIDLKKNVDIVGDFIVFDEVGKVFSILLLEILECLLGVIMNWVRVGSESLLDGFVFEGFGGLGVCLGVI